MTKKIKLAGHEIPFWGPEKSHENSSKIIFWGLNPIGTNKIILTPNLPFPKCWKLFSFGHNLAHIWSWEKFETIFSIFRQSAFRWTCQISTGTSFMGLKMYVRCNIYFYAHCKREKYDIFEGYKEMVIFPKCLNKRFIFPYFWPVYAVYFQPPLPVLLEHFF